MNKCLKVLTAGLVFAALMGAECVIVREPQRPDWSDPQAVVAIIDSVFANLNDLIQRAE